MTIDSTEPVTPAAEPATKTNVFQRIAGVLFAPAKTFEEIARRPDILAPLLILVVISALVTVAIVPKMDFETTVREQLESQNRGKMSDADMDRVVRFSSAFAKTVAYSSPLLSIAVLALIAGVLLLAFRLFGGEGGYRQAFSVTIYAWYPHVILSIISAIIIVSRGSVTAMEAGNAVLSNLGFLVDMKEQPVLFALLSSVDLFTIWAVALLTFGFSAVSKLSRVKSAVLIVSLWLVMIVVKVAFAALGAAKAAAA